MTFPDFDSEFVTLYDGESGIVLFEDVALDAIDELSSPGPQDETAKYWVGEVTQRATDAQLRAYVKRSGATVPRSVEDVREVALWIAACEHAEEAEQGDEDEFDDEDLDDEGFDDDDDEDEDA